MNWVDFPGFPKALQNYFYQLNPPTKFCGLK